jgi:hypothetical membrane protein
MSFDPRKILSIRIIGLLGAITPVIAYSGIILSIFLNLDWFSLTDNALSDLGHYGNLGFKAFVYNGGLFISGLIALIFCLAIYYQEREAFTDDSLGKTLLLGGMIAFFISSVSLMGVTIPFAMWFFGGAFYRRAELRRMGILALLVGTIAGLTWISYFVFPLFSGVAIPEALSSIAVSLWIALRGIQYYRS